MLLYRKSFQFTILMVLWAIIYLGTISTPAMYDDADTIHSEAVREMVKTGDWTTLRIDCGIRYLEKAPFMYWASAVSTRLFGFHDWAVRLPVALFALFLTFLTYRIGSRFLGDNAGFYSALIYVTSIGPFSFTRILLPDVMLTFFMTLAFFFYLEIAFESEPPRKIFGRLDIRAMGVFAASALAVLSKGLVGVIFVGLVILCHILLTRRWDMFRRLQIFPGTLVFLLVGAPWHLAAGFANKGFFWFYFINEHFLRYLGLRYPKDYDTVPLWLFWGLHLVWMFPWTIFLFGGRRLIPRSLRDRTLPSGLNTFLLAWILLILVFFSFSTSQEYYTFPTLPAFCLLLGQVLAWIDSSEGVPDRRKALIGMGVLSGVGLLAGAALFVLAWLGKGAPGAGDLSATLTFNPDKYALSFGHMSDLTLATFNRLAPLVIRTGLFLAVIPALAFVAAFRKSWRVAVLLLAFMMAGLLHSYHSGMVAFEPVLSSRALAETIEHNYEPGDRVVVNGLYEKTSSVTYYTGIQVAVLNGRFGNLWYGSYYPDAPPIFYDDDVFLAKWDSGERTFLVSEDKRLDEFLGKHPDFRRRVLAKEGGKTVLVNW